MHAKIFLDSNIVIYAFSSTEPEKRNRAHLLLQRPNAWISTQVLNELANILAKKFMMPYPVIAKAVEYVVSSVGVHSVDVSTVQQALLLASKYQYSYYDSLILASATTIGCETLYSEDLHHNQLINGTLRIDNPFVGLTGGGVGVIK